jgi:hypothetical protein
MKIINIITYKDGGTVQVKTNKGIVFIDGRTDSQTIGELYSGYPKKDNSNIMLGAEKLKDNIIIALNNAFEE